MRRNEPLKQVLSTDVISVQKGQLVSEAYRKLMDEPFHHLPVMDGDVPVGIITASDLFRLVWDVDATDERTVMALLDGMHSLESVMQSEVRTLSTDATVRDAAEALATGDLHSVLVLDGDGKLAGIVTSTDLIRFLRDQF